MLGTDGAGRIAAKGSRVRRFRVGERVWAYQYDSPKGGFYAEYVAVKAQNVAPTASALVPPPAGQLALRA